MERRVCVSKRESLFANSTLTQILTYEQMYLWNIYTRKHTLSHWNKEVPRHHSWVPRRQPQTGVTFPNIHKGFDLWLSLTHTDTRTQTKNEICPCSGFNGYSPGGLTQNTCRLAEMFYYTNQFTVYECFWSLFWGVCHRKDKHAAMSILLEFWSFDMIQM